MKNRAAITILLVTFLFVPATSEAENENWPHAIPDDADMSLRENMPDDPGYYHERKEGEEVVHVDGQWNFWSFVPQLWIDTGDPIREEERTTLGPGLHADRAWLLTPGRRDVLIAVLDSGAYWNEADLRYKYYLNAGELDRVGARPCVPTDFGGDLLDVNGDGIFNIADYEAHSDECGFDIDGEGNSNGVIDPQDLIGAARYADGVDEDSNGYIDDISGWDFYWNDNDAYDDTRFGHGNGEARDSGAQGNNGQSGIGVCPECTILMVRVGDSFVTDANDFADGVVFAVDSGAKVIQEALGTINMTTFARQALEYAYENNTVAIASAADELSYHHNFPGTTNHTVYVHAVVHDIPNRSRATTFLNFNNCTNYGAQLVLSSPGGGCSSEATGVTSGHAGLIYSYALDQELDPPISAEELRGILIMSADDINIPESQEEHEDYDGTKYPSGEGWDWHFGYGRNNVRTSLELIRDARIPPEVDIVTPLWFETIYPEGDATGFDVTGRVGLRADGEDARYDSFDYQLAAAAGVTPPENTFSEVSSGTTPGIDGVLGTVDFADFDLTGVPQDSHQFAVTLRLRACVADSGTFADGGICSEYRKSMFLHEDPNLFDGFPVMLGGSGEPSSAFYDLDDDGAEELITPETDGRVHAFDSEGGEVAGWPVELGPRKGHRDDQANDHAAACAYRPADDRGDCTTRGHVDYLVRHTPLVGSPAVANLEGDEDGDAEVVLPTADGYLYAFHADGTPVDGFPVRTDPALSANTDPDNIWDEGILAAAVLYDLDDNGDLEIITAAGDQHVYVWNHDGTTFDGFPVYCRDFARDDDPDLSNSNGNRIIATPAVGDLDNDGYPEIVVGTNEVYDDVESRYYIIHWDGNEHQGGPFEQLDPEEPAGPGRNFSLLGEVLPVVGRGIPSAASLADIDFDGYIEFAVEGIGGRPVMRKWDGDYVWDMVHMDTSTASFGDLSDVTDESTLTLVNHGAFGYLDDSGEMSYVKGAAGFRFGLAFAEGGIREEFDHQLGGWNVATGKPIAGFPRIMEDWQFFHSPAIVDLNDDGHPEVVNGSGGYLLRAFNYAGEELEGWPKHTGGWLVASPAVGDFDGDGNYDVAVSTRLGYLFVWKTTGPVEGAMEWSGFGHDNQNTFNYEHPIPGREHREPPVEPAPEGDETPDIGPAEQEEDLAEDLAAADTEEDTDETITPTPPDDDEGCCSIAPARPSMVAVLLAALGALLVLRRRCGI